MSAPVAILNTGLVTSVGLSAPTACAAIRAGVTNPSETRFMDSEGEWIQAHQVPLERPWRGRTRLAKMAVMAITEGLEEIPRTDWPQIPLLLCVAELERPGRLGGLDDLLIAEIQQELGIEFSGQSLVIPHGRVGVSVALLQARQIIEENRAPFVLVAASDSLVNWPTLRAYERNRRLLTPGNSNGFMPGEGAGALLVGPDSGAGHLLCTGLGFAIEPAHIESEQPLRGNGLTQAIKSALADAGCEMHELDFRITDLSGEQYYFKEAALALSRTLRALKGEFDIRHPAQCIGEAGAVAGAATIAVAKAACDAAYALGPNILCHAANDAGHRAATVIRFRAA